jgi:hypothetical protein
MNSHVKRVRTILRSLHLFQKKMRSRVPNVGAKICKKPSVCFLSEEMYPIPVQALARAVTGVAPRVGVPVKSDVIN